VEPNKREILVEKAQQRLTSAITFQDFVNVVSTKISSLLDAVLLLTNVYAHLRELLSSAKWTYKINSALNLMIAGAISSRFSSINSAPLYI
jgi:hypothetical protein